MSQDNENNQTSERVTAMSEMLKSEQEYEALIIKDYRHNLRAILSFEFIWGLGLPFALFATVVPAYMTSLAAPKILTGIVISLFTALCPLQLLIMYYLKNRPRKKWLMLLYLTCTLPWQIHNVIFMFFPEVFSTVVRLTIFTICVVIFAGNISAGNPLYFGISADCTPRKRRGSQFGYRVSALAVAILLMSPLARYVMTHWPEPQNFVVSFCIGNAFYLLSCICVFFIREHQSPASLKTQQSHHKKIRGLIPHTRLELRRLLRDPNYRLFIFFTILAFVPLTMASFIIVFAKEKLSLSGTSILNFTILQMVASAVGSMLLGKLADRVGYRTVGTFFALMLSLSFLLVTTLAIRGTFTAIWLYVAYGLYSGVAHIAAMMLTNFSLELRPKQSPGRLFALSNLIMTPAILLVTPLSGLLIDVTKSYVVVFALATLLSLISAAGFAILVREPRRGKLQVIRYLRPI